MAFAITNTKFEDERFSNFDEFRERKAKGEFDHQVPILQWKGKVMNESMAILRFVGKMTGLYPEDDFEAWRVDSINDFLNDYPVKINPNQFFKKDFGEEKLNEFLEIIKKVVDFLTKKLEENGKTYLVGDKITTADCFACHFITAYIFNKDLPAGETWTAKSQEIAAKSPVF